MGKRPKQTFLHRHTDDQEPHEKMLNVSNQWSEVKGSKVAQSCLILCDPVDCSLPGFSVHGILQAGVLEWVAISFSRGSSRPRDWTQVSRIGGRRFNLWATGKALQNYAETSSHTSQNGHQRKYPQTLSAGEGVERRESSYAVGGNVNWYSHYGEQCGGSLKKLKIKLPYDPTNPVPEHISREKHDPKGYMHPSVHCSTVYSTQDMEAA